MAASEPQLDVVFFDIDDTLYSTTQFARDGSSQRRAIEEMVAGRAAASDADQGYSRS